MSRPWKADEQWMECERCGFPHPVSDLTAQRGELGPLVRVDQGCRDNLDNAFREKRIAEFLKQTAKHESRDLRNEPALWFTSADEGN
jgi:hypothetical protein